MRRAVSAAALAVAVAASGCTASGSGGEDATLRILAGSELADMEPLLEETAERTGVTVAMEYTGTLDGLARVAAGEAEEFDAVWFASNRYLHLYDGGRDRVREETPVMLSPVVLGVREPRADDLGWSEGAEVTWSDVNGAVRDAEFTYGMTNPGASNSGFSALIGVASALADSGSALTAEDVERVGPDLAGFFKGQELTAGSSGWLAQAFTERADDERPVDALINYESVLLSLNRDGADLRLVYPADGVITADYPLTLLAGPDEEAEQGYGRLVEDLLSEEVQADIAERTLRRPVVSGVSGADLPSLVELPFPAHREVVDGLVADYFSDLRRPARTVYVLDVSGSMKGDRLEELKEALGSLTGTGGGSLEQRVQAFQEREEITLLPYSTEPHEPRTFVVEPGRLDESLGEVADAIGGLEALGDTATYDAVLAAYGLVERAPEDDHLTSIVLMTDGEVNWGMGPTPFARGLEELSPEAARVPVFTVLFGEAGEDEMADLAEQTGGRVFDAREQSLEEVFREIRGYQ
ncbi:MULTISPECIES: VWA domain-containing protein [Nocardiopsis]|uniref:VWA domain-containing protein n=1 Tax=Nocardiopsis changdeensis TaxID=2831969 RepID=A0ABX8BLT5_9ACTN|nr:MULTISPECIES: VWA domain-containing protein [Nocardiopsis]QUX21383.1 VWA domain-containing protein [Nocardiopsis changdeensis]QYX37314.1 VWA domain-containing protein [Nocardiopsis sp. MT53]